MSHRLWVLAFPVCRSNYAVLLGLLTAFTCSSNCWVFPMLFKGQDDSNGSTFPFGCPVSPPAPILEERHPKHLLWSNLHSRLNSQSSWGAGKERLCPWSIDHDTRLFIEPVSHLWPEKKKYVCVASGGRVYNLAGANRTSTSLLSTWGSSCCDY